MILLRHLGSIYGENIAKEALSTGQGPAKAIKMIAANAVASGWGRPEIEGDLAKGDWLKISIKDCIFCSDVPEDKASHCEFFGGLLTGIAGQLYGKDHYAEETKCMRSGAPACTFSILKGRKGRRV